MSFDDYDYLGAEETEIGLISLRRRPLEGAPDGVVTELLIDHEFLMSSAACDSEEALASEAIARHGGRDLAVRIGGLGLGHTAGAALASDAVGEVEVVELLAPVIDWCERGLFPLAETLQADARLRIVQGDAYAGLLAPPSRTFDLILIDVDHAPEEALGSSRHAFHSVDGLRRTRQHLAADGMLAVWSYAESAPFEAAMREVFAQVEVLPVPFFNPAIDETETNWLFFGRDPR